MKWLLLIYTVTTVPDFQVSLSTKVGLETKELCEMAKKEFTDANKNLIGDPKNVAFAYVPYCIQIRE